jgi:dienelactone hydrolase
MHGYGSNRNQFSTESLDLADRGVASMLIDSAGTRSGRGAGVDVQDPTYAAEVFEALVRQDVVDARRALDLLERRPEIDASRIGFIGQDYGAFIGGILAAVESRIDAFVIAAGRPEPSRFYAEELVPQESREGFAERLGRFDTTRLLGETDAPVLFQNPRQDREVTVEEYEDLVDVVDDAEVRWYDSQAELPFEAFQDRAQWIAEELDVASGG